MTLKKENLAFTFSGAPSEVSGLPRSSFIRAFTSGKGVWRRFETRYYDTIDRDLQKQGRCFYVETSAGETQQVLTEFDEPLRSRQWCVSLDNCEDGFLKFHDKAADIGLKPIFDKLCLVCEITFDRWSCEAEFGGATIDIDINLGSAHGHAGDLIGRRAPITNITLTYKKGDEAGLFALAKLLTAHAHIRLSTTQTPDWARSLEHEPPIGPQKLPPFVQEEMGRTAFPRLLKAIAMRLATLQTAILDYRDPRAVQQMRVGLRRLRVLEKVSRKFSESKHMRGLADVGKEYGDCLAPLRDWDVFLTETSPHVFQAPYAPQGAADLIAKAEHFRAETWLSVIQSVAETKFTHFLIDLFELANADDPAFTAESITTIAPVALDKAYKRARKTASRIDWDVIETVHDLRLAVKKLRYQAQLFAAIYPKEHRQPFMKALSSLQDDFGAINDAAVSQNLVEFAAKGEGAEAMRAAGFLSGFKAAETQASVINTRDKWARFIEVPPFWR